MAAVALMSIAEARADAPAGRYVVGADTVLDRETRLIWQRSTTPGIYYSWADALAYCNGLTLAGSSDWRVPTVRELQSLVDIRGYQPAIDRSAFPAPSLYNWSSSPVVYSANANWAVEFFRGQTAVAPTTTSTLEVICVR